MYFSDDHVKRLSSEAGQGMPQVPSPPHPGQSLPMQWSSPDPNQTTSQPPKRMKPTPSPFAIPNITDRQYPSSPFEQPPQQSQFVVTGKLPDERQHVTTEDLPGE